MWYFRFYNLFCIKGDDVKGLFMIIWDKIWYFKFGCGLGLCYFGGNKVFFVS